MWQKRKIPLLWTSLFFMPLFFSGAGETQGQASFAGWRACMPCHEEIVQSWQKTSHAKAIDSLRKSSQETLPGCLRCHVTAYDEPGGYVDGDLTPELAGVQCEACHGSAAAHVQDPGKWKTTLAKPGENVCQKCHTSGQDPRFNYGRKIRKVHPE